MRTAQADIEIYRQRGLAKIDEAIQQLEQRRKDWGNGMMYAPRAEAEILSDLTYLVGAIENATRASIRESLQKGNN